MDYQISRDRREEIREEAEEIAETLRDVVDQLKALVEEIGDKHAEAYLVDHLVILTRRDHGFLSSDFSVEEWLENLNEWVEDGEED